MPSTGCSKFIAFNVYMPCFDGSQCYETEVDIVCKFIFYSVSNKSVDSAFIVAGDFKYNNITIEADRIV